MGGERSLLLRRMAPLAAVTALLVPGTANGSSFTPDPVPGARTLQPDAAPTAAPEATPAPAKPSPRPVVRTVKSTPVVRRSVSVPVVRTVVTHPAASTPVVHRAAAKKTPPERPAAKPKPRSKPRPVLPSLPPVLVPRFIEAPLESDPPIALAALALGLAALTALSGAGLVFSWSRR
jgi:hypothetical protein